MTDLVLKTDSAEVAPVNLSSFASQIALIANDPNVDVGKMAQLLDMHQKMLKQDAEQQFNSCLAQMQEKLPAIRKNKKAHNSKYASYESIHHAIAPILSSFGFSMSFDCQVMTDGKENYIAYLRHKAGHCITSSMILTADTSGSKNAIQAKGSTTSYARRYLTCNMLNIVTYDDDDDGYGAQTKVITADQLKNILNLAEKLPNGKDALEKTVKHFNCGTIELLPSDKYTSVIAKLKLRIMELTA